jgi:hypothetical protein
MTLFSVMCCGKRRGLINGALVCSRCDYDHDRATVIPNEHAARDVLEGVMHLPVQLNDG